MTPPFAATLRAVRHDHGRANLLFGAVALLLAGLWAQWFWHAPVEITVSADEAWLVQGTAPVSPTGPGAGRLPWAVQARFQAERASGRLAPGQPAVLVLGQGRARPLELPARLRATGGGSGQERVLYAEFDLPGPPPADPGALRDGLRGRLQVIVDRTTPAHWLWQRLVAGVAR